jgi:NAD(P)-dependent dehydrogenase (short-subunit alcohol dehydrogenase family)
MKEDLSGKNAIVFGASTPGGMGQAIARRLTKEGAKVVVSGLGKAGLDAIAEEIGGSAFEADMTKEADIKALVDHAVAVHGKLHIAINAVGFSPRVPFKDFTEEHLMLMSRIHFIGPALYIKYVAEVIEDWGAIVNVSSLSAYDPLSQVIGYASTKRAGDRMLQGAALEYRHKKLRINGVVPSLVPTELSRRGIRDFGMDPVPFEQSFVDLTPLGRVATPEDIAAFVYMLVRDEFFETGQIMHYSGGNSLLGHPRMLA